MEKLNLNAYIHEGEWDVIEKYIRDRGDVNILNNEKKSLLHFAAERDKLDIVKSLLEKGAEINHQDTNGNTALHYAIVENFKEDDNYEAIIQLLVRRGADIYLENDEGQSPFHLVEEDSYIQSWMYDEYEKRHPPQAVAPIPIPSRNIEAGSTNVVFWDTIEEDNAMVNFDDEYRYKRYYKESTYNQLKTNKQGKKIYPFLDTPILKVDKYKAHIVPKAAGSSNAQQGGKRRNSRKPQKNRRKTRKNKKKLYIRSA